MEDDDEDDDEDKNQGVIILSVLDYCEYFLAELLYEEKICETYLETFKNVSRLSIMSLFF